MLGPRVASDDYGKYFDDNIESVFNSLKQPCGCDRELALSLLKRRKQEFIRRIKTSHKVKIPSFVLYMKLRGFVNVFKKEMYYSTQPCLGNSRQTIKYIGFSGYMGAGKSLSASYLKDVLKDYLISSTITNFAQPLKDMMINSFGFTYDEIYTQEGKASFNKKWGMTNRECLQKLGTEALRNNFHPDIWVKLAEQNTAHNKIITIFDDVRFPNEADFICRNGLLIRVDRDCCTSSSHASEQPLSVADYVINNNGSKADLKSEVVAMAKLLKII